MAARRVSFGMIGLSGSRRKFGNKPTEVDGEKFDSKAEAERWRQLLLLLKAGRIRALERQVKYRIEVNGVLICTYKADFVYEALESGAWVRVVEDVKGFANDRWPMKKKLMRAVHGVEIRET
jgi:hypothetical protein